MKFFGTSFEFDFSWKDVAVGLFQRYPNPFSKHVLTEDVIERYVKNGKLYTKKLLTKTNPMPSWGARICHVPKCVIIIEESVVDPATKTFTTYSRNITMRKWLCTFEKCIYTGSSSNPASTGIQKQTWFESDMGYLSRPILEFSLKRYANNQHKATQGLEYVITQRLPPTLKDRVLEKTGKLAEKAKHSKEKLTESAKHQKEVLSNKAKLASELAKVKAEQAKAKAELPKVKASE